MIDVNEQEKEKLPVFFKDLVLYKFNCFGVFTKKVGPMGPRG